MDGDGFDDVAVGAHGAGKVYIFDSATVSNASTLTPADADYVVTSIPVPIILEVLWICMGISMVMVK